MPIHIKATDYKLYNDGVAVGIKQAEEKARQKIEAAERLARQRAEEAERLAKQRAEDSERRALKKTEQAVRKLLLSNKFTFLEIAHIQGVSVDLVEQIAKENS